MFHHDVLIAGDGLVGLTRASRRRDAGPDGDDRAVPLEPSIPGGMAA